MQKANGCCEYCLQSNEFSFIPHQIDHIISIKHGGQTTPDNLAYACFSCNNAKGSDIGTILLPDKTFIRLFNPREDVWQDHFEMENGVIYAKSDIGKATVKVLNLNDINRIIERVT
ncbi:HNH endonuclease [Runella slithyformis]|nr:HNH endonuclease signature motif containing protein [Runella slithyformis]